MKRFLILALLALLIPSVMALPDLEDQLKGDAYIRNAGAPWLDDDAVLYFGRDKDGSLKFNSTSGYLEMVGSADGLTVNSVIVPQEMIITVPITTSEPDQTVFIADDAWQITKIEEVHATAQNTAFPNTGSVTVMKCTGTQAAASGSVLHNSTMYLNNTVETIQTPTLNASTGALNLADGDRLAININGTMTNFANGLITIHMKRI